MLLDNKIDARKAFKRQSAAHARTSAMHNPLAMRVVFKRQHAVVDCLRSSMAGSTVTRRNRQICCVTRERDVMVLYVSSYYY